MTKRIFALNLIEKGKIMSEKYVKGEELLHPNRYNENEIEAWDCTIQSLLPHTIATVVEYVIRYKHKGGLQDLEKAINWAKKASESYEYIKLCAPRVSSRQDYFKLVPFVSESNFPDLSWVQILVLREAQMLTADLEDEKEFDKSIARIIELLEVLVDLEKQNLENE